MGLLEELTGGIYGASGLGNMAGGLGIPFHPSQLAAMQQQQRFAYNGLQAQYGQMIPKEQYNLASAMQGMIPYSTQSIRKHVESKDITPRERARKQINGAVQAVKDAQLTAKS